MPSEFIKELIQQQELAKQLRDTIEVALLDPYAFNTLTSLNTINVTEKHSNNFISQVFQVLNEQEYRQMTTDEIETQLGLEDCQDVIFSVHDWYFSVNCLTPVIPIAFKKEITHD